jgi:hypothetical protein
VVQVQGGESRGNGKHPDTASREISPLQQHAAGHAALQSSNVDNPVL